MYQWSSNDDNEEDEMDVPEHWALRSTSRPWSMYSLRPPPDYDHTADDESFDSFDKFYQGGINL